MLALVGIVGLLLVVDSAVAIVGGGVEATPNEFPWAVRLNGCGGALISNKHVLTAAHCLRYSFGHKTRLATVSPDEVWVYLGGHAGPLVAQEPNALWLNGIKNIQFPFENEGFHTWDLALLEIEPINFTSTIQPIRLAKTRPDLGATVTLAGWGFLNRSKPAHALHKIDLLVSRDCGILSERFCAKHPLAESELKDACSGDSGSPLMIRAANSTDEWLLVGVMSAGLMSDKEDCQKLGGYSAYADLSFTPIKAWIERVAGEKTFF